MFQIVMGTVIAFLAVAGLVEIAVRVQEAVLRVPAGRVVFMVPVKGSDQSIEYIVRAVFYHARAHHRALPDIIVLDEGMDAETRAVCEKLADELGCVRILRRQELPERLCHGGV